MVRVRCDTKQSTYQQNAPADIPLIHQPPGQKQEDGDALRVFFAKRQGPRQDSERFISLGLRLRMRAQAAKWQTRYVPVFGAEEYLRLPVSLPLSISWFLECLLSLQSRLLVHAYDDASLTVCDTMTTPCCFVFVLQLFQLGCDCVATMLSD